MLQGSAYRPCRAFRDDSQCSRHYFNPNEVEDLMKNWQVCSLRSSTSWRLESNLFARKLRHLSSIFSEDVSFFVTLHVLVAFLWQSRTRQCIIIVAVSKSTHSSVLKWISRRELSWISVIGNFVVDEIYGMLSLSACWAGTEISCPSFRKKEVVMMPYLVILAAFHSLLLISRNASSR